MAIDTALKRRAALGRSVVMLPPADGTIAKDDWAIFLRLYLPYDVPTAQGLVSASFAMLIPGATVSMLIPGATMSMENA